MPLRVVILADGDMSRRIESTQLDANRGLNGLNGLNGLEAVSPVLNLLKSLIDWSYREWRLPPPWVF